ncbi:MAG: FecR domain-containing protein [Chitinophagaceae bacterium]|nr:FecR domain-containing protein [Chitinophagaceae bacterium]
MSNDRLKYLLEQYAADATTPEETKELFGWIKNLNDDSVLKDKVKQLWLNPEGGELASETDWNTIYAKIMEPPVIGQRRLRPRVAAAAVILVLLTAGSYWLFNMDAAEPMATVVEQVPRAELVPGGDKAVLTLSNGEQIILDGADKGTLTQEGNTRIIKLNDGQLSYSSTKGVANKVMYNTISTPRGGQYQIVLADGSKVWLNAASSLRFPTSFSGEKRKVELTGEGYFEVAADASKPFMVTANELEVQVLGTHFNVNAYGDEDAVKTTLLEGSVRISKGDASNIIKPGEQAQIKNDDKRKTPKILVQSVDADAVTAWKNGRFVFKGDNIQSVMRQLARWYDAEVSYSGNITDEEFVGVINRSRYSKISDILDMMEKTEAVSFSVTGNQIKVMPFKK